MIRADLSLFSHDMFARIWMNNMTLFLFLLHHRLPPQGLGLEFHYEIKHTQNQLIPTARETQDTIHVWKKKQSPKG